VVAAGIVRVPCVLATFSTHIGETPVELVVRNAAASGCEMVNRHSVAVARGGYVAGHVLMATVVT
jgi:hypothetical protein